MFVEVTRDVCKKDSVYSLFRAQYLHIRKVWRASVNAMTGVEDASSRGLGHQHELRHLGEEDPGGHRECGKFRQRHFALEPEVWNIHANAISYDFLEIDGRSQV